MVKVGGGKFYEFWGGVYQSKGNDKFVRNRGEWTEKTKFWRMKINSFYEKGKSGKFLTPSEIFLGNRGEF